jgi:hypothetical protein
MITRATRASLAFANLFNGYCRGKTIDDCVCWTFCLLKSVKHDLQNLAEQHVQRLSCATKIASAFFSYLNAAWHGL